MIKWQLVQILNLILLPLGAQASVRCNDIIQAPPLPAIVEYLKFENEVRALPAGVEKSQALNELRKKWHDLADLFGGDGARRILEISHAARIPNIKVKSSGPWQVMPVKILDSVTSSLKFNQMASVGLSRSRAYSRSRDDKFNVLGVMWSADENTIAVRTHDVTEVFNLVTGARVNPSIGDGILSLDGKFYARETRISESSFRTEVISVLDGKRVLDAEGSLVADEPRAFDGSFIQLSRDGVWTGSVLDQHDLVRKISPVEVKPYPNIHNIDPSKFDLRVKDSLVTLIEKTGQMRRIEFPIQRHYGIAEGGEKLVFKSNKKESVVFDLNSWSEVRIPGQYRYFSPNGDWILESGEFERVRNNAVYQGGYLKGYHLPTGQKFEVEGGRVPQFAGTADLLMIHWKNGSNETEIYNPFDIKAGPITAITGRLVEPSPSGRKFITLEIDLQLRIYELKQ